MTLTSALANGFSQRLQGQSTTGTCFNHDHDHDDIEARSLVDPRRQDGKQASGSELAFQASKSTLVSFELGTGASIYTNTLIPAMMGARSEIIFVTCFWAPSKTLDVLCQALRVLATRRAEASSRSVSATASAPARLRIRICLSSTSFFQKLFHTRSRQGFVYPPAAWPAKLGLPEPSVFEAGNIDLQVKSLFFLPFSVMHPKFLIIDRDRAFLPSCNVSWEAWLEGCVEIRGAAISRLLDFYSDTWEPEMKPQSSLPSLPKTTAQVNAIPSHVSSPPENLLPPSNLLVRFSPAQDPLVTWVLPSPHHRNPRFRPCPWQSSPTPTPTPLNIALLQLFGDARQSIFIQTPDFTSPPVVEAVLDALFRGISVTIFTSRDMKTWEQILTAGTTTSRCLRRLVKRYVAKKTGQKSWRGLCGWWRGRRDRGRMTHRITDVEAQNPRLGDLRVSYFHARGEEAVASGPGRRPPDRHSDIGSEEPVHTHVKATLVDGTYTMLGSGNMDRASWFTSQELGILFQGGAFAAAVKSALDRVSEGRLTILYDSTIN